MFDDYRPWDDDDPLAYLDLDAILAIRRKDPTVELPLVRQAPPRVTATAKSVMPPKPIKPAPVAQPRSHEGAPAVPAASPLQTEVVTLRPIPLEEEAGADHDTHILVDCENLSAVQNGKKVAQMWGRLPGKIELFGDTSIVQRWISELNEMGRPIHRIENHDMLGVKNACDMIIAARSAELYHKAKTIIFVSNDKAFDAVAQRARQFGIPAVRTAAANAIADLTRSREKAYPAERSPAISSAPEHLISTASPAQPVPTQPAPTRSDAGSPRLSPLKTPSLSSSNAAAPDQTSCIPRSGDMPPVNIEDGKAVRIAQAVVACLRPDGTALVSDVGSKLRDHGGKKIRNLSNMLAAAGFVVSIGTSNNMLVHFPQTGFAEEARHLTAQDVVNRLRKFREEGNAIEYEDREMDPTWSADRLRQALDRAPKTAKTEPGAKATREECLHRILWAVTEAMDENGKFQSVTVSNLMRHAGGSIKNIGDVLRDIGFEVAKTKIRQGWAVRLPKKILTVQEARSMSTQEILDRLTPHSASLRTPRRDPSAVPKEKAISVAEAFLHAIDKKGVAKFEHVKQRLIAQGVNIDDISDTVHRLGFPMHRTVSGSIISLCLPDGCHLIAKTADSDLTAEHVVRCLMTPGADADGPYADEPSAPSL